VVTIPGLTLRSIKRSSVLSISAKANMASACETTAVAISYSWSIINDEKVLPVVPTSKDPSRFTLPAFSLQSNTFYTVNVVVTANGQSAEASTQVYVVTGELIFVIKGGNAARIVRAGEKLVLDASNSYNENVQGLMGLAAGLIFSWSCIQTQPFLNASCSGLFNSSVFSQTSKLPIVELQALSQSIPGSVGEVGLQLMDSSSTDRVVTIIIAVTVVSAGSPTLTLNNNAKNGRMNAAQNLQLTGIVNFPSALSGNVTWELDESGADVSLAAIALSPLTATVVGKQSQVPDSQQIYSMRSMTLYLSLKANSLMIGSTYSFRLTCSLTDTTEMSSAVVSTSISSNIQVTVNSPPTPGIFTVSPTEGYELQDTFSFVVSRFQDSDLPLQYAFKYYSLAGNLVTVRSLAEGAVTTSVLPAGSSSSGFGIICVGDVFDSMMANTTNYQLVTVKVQEALNTEKVNTLLESSLSILGTSSSADVIKQASAVGLYLLNKVNCTLAPDCLKLNRQLCSRQSHTCGACLSYSKYIGAEGDSNEACLSIQEFVSLQADKSAETSKPKNCINNCSGHGKCKAFSSISHVEIDASQCLEGTLTCYVGCDCEEEYSASISCALSQSDMDQKKQFRNAMIDHLATLTSLEDPSDESVQSLLNSLTEATQAKDELTSTSIDTILSTTSFILDQAAGAAVSATSVSSVESLLDNVGSAIVMRADMVRRLKQRQRLLQASGNMTTTENDSTSLQPVDTFTGLIKSYSQLLTSAMVPGQEAVDVLGSTFKLSASLIVSEVVADSSLPCNSSKQVVLPVKLSEQLLNTHSQTATLPACRYVGSNTADDDDAIGRTSLSIMSTDAGLYDDGRFISNPVHLEISAVPCSDSSSTDECSIVLILPRNVDAPTALPEEGAVNMETQEVICAEGDTSEHFFSCLSANDLWIKCNGTFAIIETICPQITSKPSCSMLLSASKVDSDFCAMVSFTDSTVACRCSLTGALEEKRVLATAESNSSVVISMANGMVSVSYVSMLTAVTGSFLTTVKSATKLNTSVVAKGWQVIATLGTVCVLVASAMMFAHFADQDVKKKVAGPMQVKVDNKNGLAGSNSQRNNSILSRIARFGSINATQKIRPAEEMKKWQTKRQPHQNRYLSMAEEALPNVLLTSRSLSKRIIDEIKRHHRWIGVIYYFSKTFPRVLRILSLATNIVVMLFIQSLTYDLTKGDDGSCESFKSEKDCLGPRSQFSSSMSRCYWLSPSSDGAAGAGSCHYIQPDSSLTVVIFVAIFSALLSTPIALLVDWLIQHILSVPTAKEGVSEDLKPASVAPMPSPSVAPHNLENTSNKVKLQKRQSAAKRITYVAMATLDFNNLHRELQIYRKESIEDENDRNEFDCK
jgi:hypothetical protein